MHQNQKKQLVRETAYIMSVNSLEKRCVNQVQKCLKGTQNLKCTRLYFQSKCKTCTGYLYVLLKLGPFVVVGSFIFEKTM